MLLLYHPLVSRHIYTVSEALRYAAKNKAIPSLTVTIPAHDAATLLAGAGFAKGLFCVAALVTRWRINAVDKRRLGTGMGRGLRRVVHKIF